jgi:hypothetical protein
MTTTDGWYAQLKRRLEARGYDETRGDDPVRWAFLKGAAGLGDARLIGVIDGRYTTDSPSQLTARAKGWFEEKLRGPRGERFLLFIYTPADADLIAEIKPFYAGNISVATGALNPATGRHWLYWEHPWKDELFGT